jgi:hypothetical protein
MLTFTERGDGDRICDHDAACVMPFIDRQGIAQQCPERLPRSLPWCFQELLVDQFHEPQVLGTFTLRLIVQIRARQRQHRALPPHADLRMGPFNAHLPAILA